LKAAEFSAPSCLADALALMASRGPGNRPLAGGTDLIVQMRSGRQHPERLIDLKRIPEMIGIRSEGAGFLIGAATPCAAIGEHAGLRAAWPGLVEAACLIGSTQVQGRATLGGNLCNASPAADSVPALMAAGVTCLVAAQGRQREVPVASIQAGPGRTHLATDELITAFRVPARPTRTGDAYLRLIPRTEMDIAVVGTGVCLTLDADGRIAAARVALGAVAPTAVEVEAAAAALRGSTLDEASIERLQAVVRAACAPIDDKRGSAAYRIRVAAVLASRAARIAYERASR
jgi:CO/xanthine dehydrogenase FAD-binding subunit